MALLHIKYAFILPFKSLWLVSFSFFIQKDFIQQAWLIGQLKNIHFVILFRAVQNKFTFWIFVEFNIKIHIWMQKQILGVRIRQLYLWHKMRWRCRCHSIIMFLLAYPVDATGCGTAVLFIKHIEEKENINANIILFTSKLKPGCSYRMHISCIFYRDLYHCQPWKIYANSTLKKNKHISGLNGGV